MDIVHFGRDLLVPVDQRSHNANCFLCSADIEGRTTGSVRVFAGHAFINGTIAGNLLVFGGNVTLTSAANIGGRVIIVGGRLHEDTPASNPARTVLPPLIFLPIILLLCAGFGALIILTRRMARDSMAYPPLPRL
jgi:hypothetical protein